MISDLVLLFQVPSEYAPAMNGGAKKRDGRGGARPGAGRPRVIEDKERITVDFDGEDLAAIRSLAEQRSTSAADLIRRAVRQYLGRLTRRKGSD